MQYKLNVPQTRNTPWCRCLPVFLMLTMMLVGFSGCQTTKRLLGIKHYDIPQHATALKQLDYAVRQHLISRSPLNQDPEDEHADIAIAAYQKVIDAFPESKIECGRAKLGIATIYDGKDKYRKALPILEELIKDYPDDDQIQVDARFQAARIHDINKNFDQAKKHYSFIVNNYSDSRNAHFRKVVGVSQRLLMQVRVK